MPLAARLCLLPALATYSLIAGSMLVFVLVVMGLQRRYYPHVRLQDVHWTASILYANMAVLYAILLALITIGVWDQFKQAREVSEVEASSMLGLTRLVALHPNPTPKVRRLRQSMLTYAHSVVEEEYPAMGRLQRSANTVDSFHQVWAAACDLEPLTNQDSNLQQAALALLAEVQRARVARILASTKGLPGILWAVIGASTVIILGFSAIFTLEDYRMQFILNAALVLTAALVIFAVVTLNFPFLGSISVTPDGWIFVIRHLA